MTNLKNLEFTALHISGINYLSWILDVQIHLDAMELWQTNVDGNSASLKDRAKAMMFIRSHIQEDLKREYLTIEDSPELSNDLKERYEHQKTVILPQARFDWLNLRLQDYPSVTEYNSAMFKIVSQLKLCGEEISDAEMVEKTFSTFRPTNLLLQQQYRERRFTKYSELISCLLVAEQNNELLMKNYQPRPSGSTPFPEANGINFNRRQDNRGCGRGKRHYKSHGGFKPSIKTNASLLQKENNDPKASTSKGKKSTNNPKNSDNTCYRCGGKGHWSRTCRMPKHLVDLYKASKEKGKGIDANFTDGMDMETNFTDDFPNLKNLDISDYIEDVD